MTIRLLLVDGDGVVTTPELRVRQLREFPGAPGVSVHFRRVRSDRLFESAKAACNLAYRVLAGEGVVRSQLWVEYEVAGDHVNVTGRSSDLLFALALITSKWPTVTGQYPAIAATGRLDLDGASAVRSVQYTVQKVAAAVLASAAQPAAVVFYPAEDDAAVAAWRATAEIPAHVRLCAVTHLDDALNCLGITLEKVYLRNPFRGLEHFNYEDHAIFFGRDREVREVVDQLLRREQAGVPGVLVEGASGSGKSSFLRAGVLPALATRRFQSDAAGNDLMRLPVSAGVSRAIWRPGLLSTPINEQKLATSIVDCWSAYQELDLNASDVATLTLDRLAIRRRERWPSTLRFVWLIDQLEELFSLEIGDTLIDGLGRWLLRLQEEGVWTLASVRADALHTLKAHEHLRQVFGTNEGQYYLAPLSGTALDEVITRPAKAAGLIFGADPHGKTLDVRLREEAYQETDSLPPLQFTLNELYLRRVGDKLTYAAYQELGGLTGSIATTAEAVLSGDGDELRQAVPRLFRNLVSVDDQGRPSRRYAPTADIAADSQQRTIVERLVQARLCVTDQRDGQPVVAFAHDTLLQTLPALTDWLKQEAGLLQTRELALRETRLWQRHGQSDAWLAASDKLMAFKALEIAEVPLPDPVRDFITRSRRRVRRNSRLKRTAVGLIAILALVATVFGWIASKKQREAQFQTAETIKAQLRLLTEAASEHLRDDDIAYARGVILEVLKNPGSQDPPDPATVNVFQEIRANDPALAILSVAQPGLPGVMTAAYSPDGTRILTAAGHFAPRLWDAKTGIELAALPLEDDYVGSAFYSPDGTRIATISGHGVVHVRDAQSGVLYLTITKVGNRALAYSADGQRLVVGSLDGTARIVDANTGKDLRVFTPTPNNKLEGVAFSPDGAHIATSWADSTARIWNARTGAEELVLTGHDEVGSVIYSPDGKTVLTASADGNARIFDALTGRLLRVLPGLPRRGSALWGAAYSKDGTRVVTASTDHTARVWDAATGAVLKVLSGHGGILWTAAFSPDGTRVLTGSGDSTARIWDVTDGSSSTVGLPDKGVNDAEYAPGGSHIVTASDGAHLHIWDAQSGSKLMQLTGDHDDFGQAFYSDDGKQLAAVGDTAVRIWDATTGTPLLSISAPGVIFMNASYSPDGRRLVSSHEDLSMGVWDSRSGARMLALSGHRDTVTRVGFSPDGKHLLSASLDRTVRIWDSSTGVQQRVFSKHGDFVLSARYSPDGERVVSSSADRTARVWDAHTGTEFAVLSGHHGRLNDAAFSPDGRRIATASADNTLRIWDSQTGIQLAVLNGHSGSVTTVNYSPDGTHVVTTSLDNTARIWDARPPADLARQIAWAAAAESDPLTDVQRAQLGLQQETKNEKWRKASECDRVAAAFYDPDRRAAGVRQPSINADISMAACATPRLKTKDSRTTYQAGRALLAKNDIPRAIAAFEDAVSQGYRSAQIDLADLLIDKSGGILNPRRAVSLYEQAWKEGVAIAAFRLGEVFEHGVNNPGPIASIVFESDLTKAWFWYQKGADSGEPHALGRVAQRLEETALLAASRKKQNTEFLQAFTLYATAAEKAKNTDWPDYAWSHWRYRRSTLARYLAREGMMQQVADAFREVTGR